jgi:hypothetical protein
VVTGGKVTDDKESTDMLLGTPCTS